MTHLSDELLNEILDGAAAPTARAAADAHLVDCPVCAARMEDLRRLFGMLEGLPPLTPEREFAPAVLAQLALRARSERLPRALRWVALGQLTAALVVVYLLWPVVEPLEGFSLAAFLSTYSASFFESFQSISLAWPALEVPSPELQLSTATLILAAAGGSLIWLLSNGLLLIPNDRRKLWTKS